MYDLGELLRRMIEAANKAKTAILDVYTSADFHVEIKEDNSPVTDADIRSNEIIVNHLKEYFPNVAFLTEESVDDKARLENDEVFIIDPLDGTKDFVARNGQFTINIAYAYKHVATIGVILIPMRDELFYAVKNKGAFVVKNGQTEQIHASKKTSDLRCYTSNFHMGQKEKEMLEKHKDKISKAESLGSSIKGCYIALGLGEISYRFSSNTKEWDTAAMQVIVEESGAHILKFDGTPIRYNRDDVYNRDGYVICNLKENFLL